MKRRKKWQPHHRQKPRKKTERGNSRQVLKMELRNMTFGEEELSYLSSGLLRGIGPRTAEAIVKCFGVRSLDVLENTPEKLLQIRGISEERLEDIKSGYAESKVMRDLLTILAPFKITPNTAMKIYQFFGPNSVGLISRIA